MTRSAVIQNFDSLPPYMQRQLPGDFLSPFDAVANLAFGLVVIGAQLTSASPIPTGLLGALLYLGGTWLFWLGLRALMFHARTRHDARRS